MTDIQNRAFHEAHAITIRNAEKDSREAFRTAIYARYEVGEELDRVYGTEPIPAEHLVELTRIYLPSVADVTGTVYLRHLRQFFWKTDVSELDALCLEYPTWTSIMKDYIPGHEAGHSNREARKREREHRRGWRLSVIPVSVLEKGELAGYEPDFIRKKCAHALEAMGWETINAIA